MAIFTGIIRNDFIKQWLNLIDEVCDSLGWLGWIKKEPHTSILLMILKYKNVVLL